MLKRIALIALFGVASATLVGAQETKPIEVLHSFSTEGEKNALAVYRQQFLKEGGQWVDSTMGSGGAVRAAIVRRILGGNPPGAAFHQNKRAFRELIENGQLHDLTAVARAEKWAEVMTPEAYENITQEGTVYAAPVQTQSVNFLYGNQAILQRANVTALPRTMDELLAALEAVKQKVPGVIPLAMAAEDNDMRRMFTASVVSVIGPAMYRKIYVEKDQSAVMSDEFRKGVEAFRRLKDYVDASWATREWNDATNLVITERAAFQIMGDWAKGALIDAGKQPDKDFYCGFLNDVVLASGSVFIFPKTADPALTRAQEHLAKVVMSKDVQVPFALAKGTIPTRTDVDSSRLDSCSRKAATLQGDPARSVQDDNRLLSPQAIGKIQDLVKSYWGTNTVTSEQFVRRFAAIIAAEK
jgi:glucose/mannose transport system substrate-binding protein